MSETYEQFKSLTLSKGRGDDYCIAKRQFESLTSTKVQEALYITVIDQNITVIDQSPRS